MPLGVRHGAEHALFTSRAAQLRGAVLDVVLHRRGGAHERVTCHVWVGAPADSQPSHTADRRWRERTMRKAHHPLESRPGGLLQGLVRRSELRCVLQRRAIYFAGLQSLPWCRGRRRQRPRPLLALAEQLSPCPWKSAHSGTNRCTAATYATFLVFTSHPLVRTGRRTHFGGFK